MKNKQKQSGIKYSLQQWLYKSWTIKYNEKV